MPKAKRIEDMSDAELSRLSGKAYDEAMPEADTSFGKMSSSGKNKKPPVTKAQKIADEMELERTYPMSSKMAKETPTMAGSATDALKAGLGIPLAMGVDMITGPKRRSKEDMSELAREVAKGQKYAKGGSVSSASRRADGIATKGKTKGRFV